MTKKQLEVIFREGISINSKKVKPEVLVTLLSNQVLKFQNSQLEWKDLIALVSDRAGVNIPSIEETSKCRLNAVPGQRIYLYGISAPGGRCSYTELLLNEILSSKQEIATREYYPNMSENVCAAISSQMTYEVQKDIIRGELH